MASGTDLTVTVDGATQVIATLVGVEKQGANLKPAMDKSAELVKTTIKQNFSSNGRLLDKPWEARKQVYSWPMLNKTGEMKGSFKHVSTSKDATISNTNFKFKYHQLGTRRGLPARKMLGITFNDAQKIAQIITDHMMKGVNNG